MPNKLKDAVRHKFKKKNYNNRDWKLYEAGLRSQGDITIWFCEDAIAGWNPPVLHKRKRGRQKKYSDLAIETAYVIGLVYKKKLRQTEGFMRSIVKLLRLDLDIPDHTTLSRRCETIVVSKKKPSPNKDSKPITVIIDSTGLKVFGEKEWMSHKHGTKQRKVWRKLHLCIDEDGEILSSTLTCHTISDTSQVEELLKEVKAPIKEMLGDGGYDHPATYHALNAHRSRHPQSPIIQAIIPPNTGFQEARETDSLQRLHNIHLIEDKGKLSWQNQMDYGRRSKVENTMHRYKTLIGNKLRSKTFESQFTETKIAVQILNRMRNLCVSKVPLAA